MKKSIFILIPLLIVTFSFAANGQKGKNNAKPANVVVPPSTPAAPAKVKKDFTNWLATWAKDSTKRKMQFYGGDTIFLTLGASAFEPVVNEVGDLVVVDRRIFIAPNRMGTFSKMDKGTGQVFITFAVSEKGKIPGDTIDVPFLPNGTADNVSYVLKAVASNGHTPGTAQKSAEKFTFNNNEFTISKGAFAVPLKVVVGTDKNYVMTEDKKVNAAPAVTVNQGFDPFVAPTE